MTHQFFFPSQRSYQKYFHYVTFWLALALFVTGSFSLPTASAATEQREIQIQSLETISAAEESGYQVGTLVNFTIKIANTNPLWIHVLPVDTIYDSHYLEWVSSTPSPDIVAQDTLHWNDLTLTNGNVQPYRFATISYTFKALKTTNDLPDGLTTIHFAVSGAKAGPSEQDSSESEIVLSDKTYSLSIRIYAPSSSTATPTTTNTATTNETATPTVNATDSVTATVAATKIATPSATATPTATDAATPYATATSTPSPISLVTATTTAIPSSTQPFSVTTTMTITPQQTPSPAKTITPISTPQSLAQPIELKRSLDEVEIGWQTSDESKIAGFNLVRYKRSGTQEQVNEDLITALHSGETKGATYALVDTNFSLTQDNQYVLFIQLKSAAVITTEMGILSAVELQIANQSIELAAQGITIQWETVDETYITGFDLLRYDLPATAISASEPPLTTVNESTITAIHSGEAKGAVYKLTDSSSRIGGGGGYGYKLRLLLRNGESTLIDLGTQPAVEITVNVSIAKRDDKGLTLRWNTTDETIITGFNILRQGKESNEVRLNSQVIEAIHSGEATGAAYQFLDTTSTADQNFVYVVETILIDKSTVRYLFPVVTSNSQLFLPLVTR